MQQPIAFAPFLYFGSIVSQQNNGAIGGPAQSACYNLYHVMDGSLTVGGTIIRPGQAGLAQPGTTVQYITGTRFVRLAFDITYRKRRVGKRGFLMPTKWTPQPSWTALFQVELPKKIEHEFLITIRNLIYNLTHTALLTVADQLRAQADLTRLLVDYVSYLDRKNAKRVDQPHDSTEEFKRRIERYIMERLAGGVTIKEIAELMGCSHDHLTRKYKSIRGQTPMAFLRSYRIEKACEYLRGTHDHSLAEIAHECGFRTVHNFCREFQAMLNTSPRVWQREHA